jgi:hypothetical protein
MNNLKLVKTKIHSLYFKHKFKPNVQLKIVITIRRF